MKGRGLKETDWRLSKWNDNGGKYFPGDTIIKAPSMTKMALGHYVNQHQRITLTNLY